MLNIGIEMYTTLHCYACVCVPSNTCVSIVLYFIHFHSFSQLVSNIYAKREASVLVNTTMCTTMLSWNISKGQV